MPIQFEVAFAYRLALARSWLATIFLWNDSPVRMMLYSFCTIALLTRRSSSRIRRREVGLLSIATLMLQLSIALGANPDMFQYGPTYVSLPDVPGENTSYLGYSNITCLGDFGENGWSNIYLVPGSNSTNGSRPEFPLNSSGRCLYNTPVQLVHSCSRLVKSFGTMFQGFIYDVNGTSEGLAFFIGSDSSAQGEDGGYLGWLTSTSNPQTGHNFAVEIDLFREPEFNDPADVHVGINTNSLTSVNTSILEGFRAGFREGSIRGDYNHPGNQFIVWIQYNGSTQILDVFLSWQPNYTSQTALPGLLGMNKSSTPIISTFVDLTGIFNQDRDMFVGLSGSVTNVKDSGSAFEINTWTFNSDGPAPDYPRNPDGSPQDVSAESAQEEDAILAKEARRERLKKLKDKVLQSVLFGGAGCFVLFMLIWPRVLEKKNVQLTALAKKYQIEEGVLGRGPQNFKFKLLSAATNQFSSNALLGTGGFGSVFKGSLLLKGNKQPTDIAVKRISATSHQGAQEFLAEVKVIGQVRHKNLVRLLGWCHEKRELLLVYDYMPNGSLDHHLYTKTPKQPVLTWARRLKIVSGVARALAFLHTEWEQRVIHRDVKSSNVMLDSNFNARLGDFGLARLSEHHQAPPSTLVLAGTYGYIAPELAQTLKPTEKTDVYSFGALVLEVATGKKPLLWKEDRESLKEILLVNWVWGLYESNALLDAADSALHQAYDPGEMRLFLQIGLLCSHPNPVERPNMREVINIWTGSSPFPPLPRSRPIQVFALPSDCLVTDEDTDTRVSFLNSIYGRADEDGIPALAVDSHGHNAVTIPSEGGDYPPPPEIHGGSEGVSPTSTLRYRPRSKSTTSLPF